MNDDKELNWPSTVYNLCVLGHGVACNDMGHDFPIDTTPVTFNIHIAPPDGVTVTATSTAVGKLKNILEYTPDGQPSGVQYPHLSIRCYNYAECLGCASSTGEKNWGWGNCEDCTADLPPNCSPSSCL